MKQDEELLEAWVAREDRAALDELFGRHYPGVYQVVLRIVHNETDARDVAQTTFLKALRKVGSVRQKDRFRYWLLRIAVNEARQHHRRARPSVSLDDLAEVFAAARRATVEREAGRREFELELERALETMAEPLKTPLVLHYYQSLSLAEVAHVLELPKSTVQSRCERAVALLRTRFRRSPHATALVPLLAARFPDLAASGTAASTPAVAGALAMKSWSLAAAVLAVALLLLHVSGVLDTEGIRDSTQDEAGTGPDLREATAPDPGVPTLEAAGAPQEPDPGAAAPATARRVTTEGAGTITGRVMALRTGRAVPGARIEVRPTYTYESGWIRKGDARYFENRYVSDADGVFACDHLPVPGVYDLCVRHARFAYAERFAVEIPDTAPSHDVGVVLVHDAEVLVGRVVDTAGHPVAGARITAGTWRESGSPLDFRLAASELRGGGDETGSDGRFRLEGLAAGVHRVRVDAPGYATASYAATPVPANAPLVITLEPQAPVHGRVEDAQGRPVGGARVTVSISESRRRGSTGIGRQVPWAILESASDGGFALEGLPTGRGFALVVEATHEGFDESRVERAIEGGGQVTCILRRLQVPRGGTVRLRPLPVAGALPRGARGLAMLRRDADPLERTAPLDADTAVFTFEGVPPGTWHLRVLVEGFVPSAEAVEVGAGGLDAEVPLQAGRVLEGRVLDGVTGAPVAGATVAWVHSPLHEALSDGEGRYRLPGISLTPGSLHSGAFSARAPGYVARGVDVVGPEGRTARLDIRLVPLSALRHLHGRVRDTTGAGVLGARVRLQTRAGEVRSTTTDVTGAFTIGELEPEHLGTGVVVAVDHPGYAPLVRQVPKVAEEAPLELVIEGGRRLRGRVLDRRGQPLPAATVGFVHARVLGAEPVRDEYDAWALYEALQRRTTTAADGSFTLTRVPSEEGAVLAFHAEARWVPEDARSSIAEVDPHGPVDGVTLTLDRGRVLRGTVADTDGRPVVGALVSADGVLIRTRTDAHGAFDLTPVFVQGDRLAVTARSETGYARTSVPVGELERVRLVLRRTGHVVGRVLDARGQPAEELIVAWISPDGTTLGSTRTDGGGTFHLRRKPAGPARLEVRARPGAAEPLASWAIVVEPGATLDVGELRLP